MEYEVLTIARACFSNGLGNMLRRPKLLLRISCWEDRKLPYSESGGTMIEMVQERMHSAFGSGYEARVGGV